MQDGEDERSRVASKTQRKFNSMQEEQSGVETKPHSRSWRCLLTGNSKVKLTEKPHFEERGRKSPHMTNECNVDGGNHLQTLSLVQRKILLPSEFMPHVSINMQPVAVCLGPWRRHGHRRPARRTHNLIESMFHKHTLHKSIMCPEPLVL